MSADEVVRPTPEELIAAHGMLRRLAQVVGPGHARDMDGKDVWEGLVDGRRMLAVATAVLGADDERYAEAWDRMLNES